MPNTIKNIAITAAKKAGELLLKEYKKFDREGIKLKSKHEIVTRADLLSEEIIIKEIKKSFPLHGILSEECGVVGSLQELASTRWIIDPLDGTTNFSMHNPLWAVSIAVAMRVKSELKTKASEFKDGEDEEEIVMGVIYAPAIGEMFVAEKGKGASLNGKKIQVSPVRKGKVLNTFCHGKRDTDIKKAINYYRKQKLSGLDCRQLGSAALELGYVSAGRIESIMIPGANLWDVSAGILLVNEAGGIVTDFSGQEWNLKSKDMLATNGLVHRDILKVVKEA